MFPTKSAKGSSPPGIRLLGCILFSVLLLGTIVAISKGRAAYQDTLPSDHHLVRSDQSALHLLEMKRRQQKTLKLQREELVSEARALLNVVETTERRIQRASAMLSSVSDLGNANQNGLGDEDSIQRNSNLKDAAFPLDRFASLSRNQQTRTVPNNATIFVGITSHRHPLCASMISNLFRRALNKERVYIGLVEIATSQSDAACLPEGLVDCQLHDFCLTDHVRVRTLDPPESRGLAYSRFLASLLYRGQDFVMFASVASYFAPHWDALLLSMHAEAVSLAVREGSSHLLSSHGGVVISTIPDLYDKDGPLPVVAAHVDENATELASFEWAPKTTSFLCRQEFAAEKTYETSELPPSGFPARGVPYFGSVVMPSTGSVVRQHAASTHFFFANASLLMDVPMDPYLLSIEHPAEEDALFSARLWAAGWESFSPSRSVVFSAKIANVKVPSVSGDIPGAQLLREKTNTMQRIQYLMHALHKGTRRAIIADDVATASIVAEALRFGVSWSNAAHRAEGSSGRNQSRVEGGPSESVVPLKQRNLETWYRYCGLNPASYSSTKEWCSVARSPANA